MTNNHKIVAAGAAFIIAEPALALAHAGGVGVIVGLGVAAAAYVFADDFAALTGRAQPSTSTPMPTTDKLGKFSNLGYRMLNGKSVREAQETRLLPENEATQLLPLDAGEYNGWNDADVDEVLNLGGNKKYIFSDVLNTGFRPSINKIFLGRLSNGEPVYVAVKDLCHIALAGLTGNGKGNLMRLIMAQLCAIGVKVVMLNPHYQPYDESGGEDWTPFIPKLETHPADCAEYPSIGQYIKHIAVDVLRMRIERRRKNQPMGKPYFVIIDELPAIVGKVKDAPGHIAELLREGRKFGIYLVIASQDFQVKTIGMDDTGGGVRKCLKTVFYVGGDPATARALLGKDENDKPIPVPENDLGMGTVMLRCSAVRYPQVAQVPFVDNEALYRLVGPSTLDQIANDDEPETDHLDLDVAPRVQSEQPVVKAPSNAARLETITELYKSGRIDLDTFVQVLGNLEITDSDVTRSTEEPQTNLRLVPQPAKTALSPELQRALELYQEGYNTARPLGEQLGCGKTKAAELIIEMEDLGLIEKRKRV